MKTLAVRVAFGGALLLAVSQIGSQIAVAQQSCGTARYGVIGRQGDSVLLLDQQQGVIYNCPVNYVSRCYRQSAVE